MERKHIMSLPVARVGVYLLLSVIAVAAVAGGLALSRRAGVAAEREHACWGASAG
jgi:hypothetical protein